VDDNFFAGLRGRLAYEILDGDWYDLAPLVTTEVYHYDEDAFGVVPSNDEPLPGGYFSPRFSSNRWALLGMPADRPRPRGGPALQAVNEPRRHRMEARPGRMSLVFFVRESPTDARTDYPASAAPTRFAGKASLVLF
jgi:hypothetical protein